MFRRIQAIEEISCVTKFQKMEMNFTVSLELHILHSDKVIYSKSFYIKFIQLWMSFHTMYWKKQSKIFSVTEFHFFMLSH